MFVKATRFFNDGIKIAFKKAFKNSKFVSANNNFTNSNNKFSSTMSNFTG
jgi:hypothetical protein